MSPRTPACTACSSSSFLTIQSIWNTTLGKLFFIGGVPMAMGTFGFAIYNREEIGLSFNVTRRFVRTALTVRLLPSSSPLSSPLLSFSSYLPPRFPNLHHQIMLLHFVGLTPSRLRRSRPTTSAASGTSSPRSGTTFCITCTSAQPTSSFFFANSKVRPRS